MCRDGVDVDPAVIALSCGASFVVEVVSCVVTRVFRPFWEARGIFSRFPGSGCVPRNAVPERGRAVRPGPSLFPARSFGALTFVLLSVSRASC